MVRVAKKPEAESLPMTGKLRATVARGRTVYIPDPERKVFRGRTPDTGVEVYGQALAEFGPGQEVELPADEVASLRGLGYLIDPDKVAPAPTNGHEGASVMEIKT